MGGVPTTTSSDHVPGFLRFIARGKRPNTAFVFLGTDGRFGARGLRAAAARSSATSSRAVDHDAANQIVALDPRWTVVFDTAPAAAAGFDLELAYVPLKGGELQAIDLNRGVVKWKATLTTALTPATGDGLVFAAGEGLITALEQRSGATIWQTPLEGALATPLYWDTGWLIVSLDSGDLVALRAQDGQIIWRQALGSPLASTPTPAGDHVYLALRDGRLVVAGAGDRCDGVDQSARRTRHRHPRTQRSAHRRHARQQEFTASRSIAVGSGGVRRPAPTSRARRWPTRN